MNFISGIKGVNWQSFCDWPDHIVAIFFIAGCNFHCPTCHNYRMAWDHKDMPSIDEKILSYTLKKFHQWYDGITVSGGEPTIYPGLEEFLSYLQTYKLPVKLDTNGMRPDVVERLLQQELVDTFAVDIKGPWELYPELTGSKFTADEVKTNFDHILHMAARHPDRFYFRTTNVPLLKERNVDMCNLKDLVPEGCKYYLQPYQDTHIEK